eukprot:1157243-Pelagomonas_calceolata.AAC.2
MASEPHAGDLQQAQHACLVAASCMEALENPPDILASHPSPIGAGPYASEPHACDIQQAQHAGLVAPSCMEAL